MSLRSTSSSRISGKRWSRATRALAAISVFVAAYATATVRPVYSAVSDKRAAQVSGYGCTVATEPSAESFARHESGIRLGTTLADFTGDHNPDIATLELQQLNASAAFYRLEIHLSEGGSQSLAVTGPSRRLIITPIDVTGDGTVDLVIRVAESGTPVAVFLNDGCGRFAPNAPERFPKACQPVPSGREFANVDVRFAARDAAQGPNQANFEILSGGSHHEQTDHFSSREEKTSASRTSLSLSGRAPPASA